MNILKLTRFISSHLLIILILITIFILSAYTTRLVYNHYKNISITNTNINSVVSATYDDKINITPTSTIIPRNMSLSNRGGITRQMDEKLITEPVVVNKVVEVKKEVVKDSSIFNITMYTLGYNECAKTPNHPAYGLGASGIRVKENSSIAMGKSWKFGTKVKIDGFDTIFTNVDTGSKIYSDCIDVFTNNLKQAKQYGRQKRKVWIIEYGNGKVK